jgi:hypothetical protein
LSYRKLAKTPQRLKAEAIKIKEAQREDGPGQYRRAEADEAGRGGDAGGEGGGRRRSRRIKSENHS